MLFVRVTVNNISVPTWMARLPGGESVMVRAISPQDAAGLQA
jgi:hypothetical protein